MMRLAIVVALCACGGVEDGRTATNEEVKTKVACDEDWGASDGVPGIPCDAPCEYYDDLGSDSLCKFDLPADGWIPATLDLPCGAGFSNWRGRRGCCVVHSTKIGGPQEVVFYECKPL